MHTYIIQAYITDFMHVIYATQHPFPISNPIDKEEPADKPDAPEEAAAEDREFTTHVQKTPNHMIPTSDSYFRLTADS